MEEGEQSINGRGIDRGEGELITGQVGLECISASNSLRLSRERWPPLMGETSYKYQFEVQLGECMRKPGFFA